jgi:hypothetical protein
MMKDSKILLATIVVCAIALAVFQYFLATKALNVNLRAAQEINKEVQRTPSPSPSVSPTASTSATPKGKATPTPKATVKPTETPEASVEATPAE